MSATFVRPVSALCTECEHLAHPGEQCPAWYPEENLPCCGCFVEASSVEDPKLDSGSSNKEVVMDFAYKADLIFEVMVTQKREQRTFDEKISSNVPSQCRRCMGTGRFITGTVNGKPSGPGGQCFRCAGKGFQTKQDRRRNWGYDNFGQRVSAEEMEVVA